jgi:hypothetical protein
MYMDVYVAITTLTTATRYGAKRALSTVAILNEKL